MEKARGEMLIRGKSDRVCLRLLGSPDREKRVVVRVKVLVGKFRGSADVRMRVEELARFVEGVRLLQRSLRGEAALCAEAERVRVRLEMLATGRVKVSGFLQGDRGEGNRLQFQLETDQSYLKETIASAERLVKGVEERGGPS